MMKHLTNQSIIRTVFLQMIRSVHVILLLSALAGCTYVKSFPDGDSDNGGLFLPDGFGAVVVADNIGRARHLAINTNGDIYVKLRSPHGEKGSVALRDTNNDGKADIIKAFGDYVDEGEYGTAMRVHKGYLYFSTAGVVYRTKLTPGKLIPESKSEVILVDNYKKDPHGYEHIAKPVTFDDAGHMYVPFGSPGDACQELKRVPNSPGRNPCPELTEHGGIWQFDANKKGQTIKDGKRYATGLRSIVAMDWNHKENSLYALQHGRDNLVGTWPGKYTAYESAVLPSEEFFRIKEGTDAGWPYYYYDHIQKKKLLNPEYGGDGKITAKGDQYEQPLIGFPGHWAPNDLLFYTGDQFPERYKHGAFIAFHGSTIRAPYPQAGYFVAFVPIKNGVPSGDWEVFADGFAGVDTIVNTSDARARPMGLAMGPDGSLYITESNRGKIWRILYKGDRKSFGAKDLAGMERRKAQQPNIKTPDEVADNLERGKTVAGEHIYNTYCAGCHQRNGKGDGNRFPPLVASEWVTDKRRLLRVMLQGMNESITVNGVAYNGLMPSYQFLQDTEIAAAANYIRKKFNNISEPVRPEEVSELRKSNAKN
jgi:glucose/arabinose dehydrogenase/cytochrome c553